MTSRHFYKHKLTGIIAPLNDDFAAAFGESLTRVNKADAPEGAKVDTPVPTPETPVAQDDAPADSDNKEKK